MISWLANGLPHKYSICVDNLTPYLLDCKYLFVIPWFVQSYGMRGDFLIKFLSVESAFSFGPDFVQSGIGLGLLSYQFMWLYLFILKDIFFKFLIGVVLRAMLVQYPTIIWLKVNSVQLTCVMELRHKVIWLTVDNFFITGILVMYRRI